MLVLGSSIILSIYEDFKDDKDMIVLSDLSLTSTHYTEILICFFLSPVKFTPTDE